MHNEKYVSGNQWIIDTHYSAFEEFHPLLTVPADKDYSYETVAFGASQYPLWHNPEESLLLTSKKKYGGDFEVNPAWDSIFAKVFAWTKKRLLLNGIKCSIVPAISWYVEYREGGWQTMHTHSSNCITQVIYMDGDTALDPLGPPKETAWGSLFAVMNGVDKVTYKTFMSTPGRCLLMTGDVMHGVYPVRSVPRRSIIIDYMIKYD